VSAGALLAPDVCVLSRDEAADGVLRIEEGLGLAHDLVIEVHFSELDRLPHLLEAMSRLQANVGWGIDEPACMVLEDGQIKRVLGQSVYKVAITDFESGTHQITEYVGS
jgi:cyanophycinase-like exopeptidase